MTVLEATVEIIKAALQSPNNSAANPISSSTQRSELIKTISEVYNTLDELKKGNKPVSKQF